MILHSTYELELTSLQQAKSSKQQAMQLHQRNIAATAATQAIMSDTEPNDQSDPPETLLRTTASEEYDKKLFKIGDFVVTSGHVAGSSLALILLGVLVGLICMFITWRQRKKIE